MPCDWSSPGTYTRETHDKSVKYDKNCGQKSLLTVKRSLRACAPSVHGPRRRPWLLIYKLVAGQDVLQYCIGIEARHNTSPTRASRWTPGCGVDGNIAFTTEDNNLQMVNRDQNPADQERDGMLQKDSHPPKAISIYNSGNHMYNLA